MMLILADRLTLILEGQELRFCWITQPLTAGMLEQHAGSGKGSFKPFWIGGIRWGRWGWRGWPWIPRGWRRKKGRRGRDRWA
jgi:hypothetical protein